MTKQEAKQRYWDKKYAEAPIIKCACGCGEDLKSVDHYARPKKFINGHNGRKYTDSTQHKREWNHRNREKRYAYKKEYGHKRKAKLLKMRGGKCSICGLNYDGTNAALFDMHHRDPDDKEFLLNQSTLFNVAWSKIEIEAQKCNIVCSNCHRLFHSDSY